MLKDWSITTLKKHGSEMLGMKSDKPVAILILQQLVNTVCPQDILNFMSLVTIG